MTAHHNNPLHTVIPDTTRTVPVTHASRTHAGGTAAVIVWRITPDTADAPDTDSADAGDSPLTPRLARHLVTIYSDVHDTVVDLDADTHLRHAAETTGRAYQTVTYPAVPDAADPPTPAALVTLRSPRPTAAAPARDAGNLLDACRQHLAADGNAIVVLTVGADTVGPRDGDHGQVLQAAAHAAGLRHRHDILVVDADNGHDTFTYATDHDTTTPGRNSDSDIPRQPTGTRLMVFGLPGSRS